MWLKQKVGKNWRRLRLGCMRNRGRLKRILSFTTFSIASQTVGYE
jgi:hypothetical protein